MPLIDNSTRPNLMHMRVTAGLWNVGSKGHEQQQAYRYSNALQTGYEDHCQLQGDYAKSNGADHYSIYVHVPLPIRKSDRAEICGGIPVLTSPLPRYVIITYMSDDVIKSEHHRPLLPLLNMDQPTALA